MTTETSIIMLHHSYHKWIIKAVSRVYDPVNSDGGTYYASIYNTCPSMKVYNGLCECIQELFGSPNYYPAPPVGNWLPVIGRWYDWINCLWSGIYYVGFGMEQSYQRGKEMSNEPGDWCVYPYTEARICIGSWRFVIPKPPDHTAVDAQLFIWDAWGYYSWLVPVTLPIWDDTPGADNFFDYNVPQDMMSFSFMWAPPAGGNCHITPPFYWPQRYVTTDYLWGMPFELYPALYIRYISDCGHIRAENITETTADLTGDEESGYAWGIAGGEIEVIVPAGTSLKSLTPTIVHTGESVLPNSGVAQDFSVTKVYAVSDADGEHTMYNVNVLAQNLPATAITSFQFQGLSPMVKGNIFQRTHTITAYVPDGTDVSALVPTIVHKGSTIAPANGAAQDFTSPVKYTVTAFGETQDYMVTVIGPAPDTLRITAFVINDSFIVGVITQSSRTIVLHVPDPFDVTSLVPTITFKGYEISPPSGVPQNFTNPVYYTLTAHGGREVVYTVTVAYDG